MTAGKFEVHTDRGTARGTYDSEGRLMEFRMVAIPGETLSMRSLREAVEALAEIENGL